MEDWQRLLVAVYDLAGGSTDRIVNGLAAADRAGLGYPDPGLMSDEFEEAARYLKENGLVTGRATYHADLRLTGVGAEEARRLKG